MNEQQITNKAILYLSQVVSAYAAVLQTGQMGNETSAIHCIHFGTKHILTIIENIQQNDSPRHRMFAIRDAMFWLLILRKRQMEVELVANSGMPMPSEKDVESLHSAANMFRES
jgi:hypothetical protein